MINLRKNTRVECLQHVRVQDCTRRTQFQYELCHDLVLGEVGRRLQAIQRQRR